MSNFIITAEEAKPKSAELTFCGKGGKIITINEIIEMKETIKELQKRIIQLECQPTFGPAFLKDLEEDRGLVPNLDILFVKK
jgi:hypothetical protein